jgi:hypothetical protein
MKLYLLIEYNPTKSDNSDKYREIPLILKGTINIDYK